jgi:hypothetical protein
MTTQDKYQQLVDLKGYIETEAFQNFIMKPLYDEMAKVKKLRDLKSWDETCKAKGQEIGLEKLKDILKQVEIDLKNTRTELEDEVEGSSGA